MGGEGMNQAGEPRPTPGAEGAADTPKTPGSGGEGGHEDKPGSNGERDKTLAEIVSGLDPVSAEILYRIVCR